MNVIREKIHLYPAVKFHFPVGYKCNLRGLRLYPARKSPKNVVTGELGLCKPDINVIRVNYIYIRPENLQKPVQQANLVNLLTFSFFTGKYISKIN